MIRQLWTLLLVSVAPTFALYNAWSISLAEQISLTQANGYNSKYTIIFTFALSISIYFLSRRKFNLRSLCIVFFAFLIQMELTKLWFFDTRISNQASIGFGPLSVTTWTLEGNPGDECYTNEQLIQFYKHPLTTFYFDLFDNGPNHRIQSWMESARCPTFNPMNRSPGFVYPPPTDSSVHK